MVTASFVYELQFVAKYFNAPASVDLKVGDFPPVTFTVVDDVLTVEFLDDLIWKEKVVGADSNFGVESCQVIFRIIEMISAGDDSWKKKIPHIFA